jgi:hypothetical protein
MTKCTCACYNFYPVGQGLFASGLLYGPTASKQFSWVYDCGTSSSQDLVSKALMTLAHNVSRVSKNGKVQLDLVTLSHFDKDHISGLVSLLKIFSVGTLLLPYMPLWQRLVLAFSIGVDTQQALMQFFINPVSFIIRLEGANIERILFVPSGRNSAPTKPVATPRTSIMDETDVFSRIDDATNQDQAPWLLDFDEQQPRDTEERNDFEELSKSIGRKTVSVSMLAHRSSVRVAATWEFLPYNDGDIWPIPNEAFRQAVAGKRATLLSATLDSERRSALAAVRDEYDKHFGNTQRKRNLISLFLYSGPVGAIRSKNVRIFTWNAESMDYQDTIPRWRGRPPTLENRCSILYTGDGYLNTRKRLNRLLRYMGTSRIKQLTCVQVMHHGSESNWHEGVAARLSPDTSVFCADPNHKRFRHPHASVVRDFLRYGPMLVDETDGVTVSIRVC